MYNQIIFRRQGACHKTIAALCALLAGFLAAGAHGAQKPIIPLLPVAKFTEMRSTATEQIGRIELKVAFSGKFVGRPMRVGKGGLAAQDGSIAQKPVGQVRKVPIGRLSYSVHGTADQGTDFKLLEDTATIGRGVADDIDIVIDLLDDALVEGIETIVVRLEPGKGYRLEQDREHVVELRDNDANWRVVHDVDGMRFDYGMRIIRNGGSTVATVTSDGGSGLPRGIYPVDISSADDNRFEAVHGPVTVAADRTLLGAEIGRTFKLVADPSRNDGHKVDHERLLKGAVTETWTSESAPHLARGNPISGTFLMSRIIDGVASGNTRAERSKGVNQDDSVDTGGLESESECVVADMSGTSNYAVMPEKFGSQTLWNPEMARVGQPFVAAHTPYPNFVTDTLNRARAELYYDKATTKEAKDLAAFRYKALLYEKEQAGAETYIRARFDQLADLWNCDARKRAHQTAQTVIDALRYAPWNRELRWALLDIYYDIAVADKALAQEKHVAVAESMIKPALESRGELIDEEIAILEDALPLYRHALAGYMKAIRGGFGVDVADFEAVPALHGEPFGYLIFRQEVPHRSPLAALFRKNGAWMLPQDAGTSDEQPKLFQGYKDVTLLFELLREYLRTAEQLSKRYVIRSEPSDFDRAEKLIGDTLLATWLEGNALLAMFPEILEKNENKPIDPKSGLQEAVAGYRHSYSALGHLRSMLSGGDTNILGLPDDYIPIVAQSVMAGDPGKEYFHSYDYLKDFLDRSLERAKADLEQARKSYDNYKDRQDQLTQQFADRNEQYDERLRQIGNEINEQQTNIEAAAKSTEWNSKRIENLVDEIRIEVERWAARKKINNAMQQLYVKYGDKQADLSIKIAEINAIQTHNSNMVAGFLSLTGAVGLAVATGGAAVPALIAFGGLQVLTQAGNASSQASMEAKKGELQASKERLAALEQAELTSLEGVLLDVDIKTRIQKLLLQMSEIVIESEEAALRCRREMQRLSALYLEKEALERRKAESNEGLADRYFADPSHRLLSHAAVLRSQSSFTSAQRELFMAILAAEYKWNGPFEHTPDGDVTFTKQSLFRTRNADELEALWGALKKWDDRTRKWTKRNKSDVIRHTLSIRDHIGFAAELKDKNNQRCDHKSDLCVPSNDRSTQALDGFQRFIAKPDNYVKPEDTGLRIDPKFTRLLKLDFGTGDETDELFLYDRWNEKVAYLKIELYGAERKRSSQNSILPGHLTYGGISRIRNRGEGITEYPVRSWSYDDGRWTSEEVFFSAVKIQLWNDPDVPEEEKRIKTFNELSTATTNWTLYIPVEWKGEPLLDVSEMIDVVFHIGFYFYTG